MLNGLFNNPTLMALEHGLDACSLRGKLIANNIANVDTPNYKAQRLNFEDILASNMNATSEPGKLQLIQTDPRHLPGFGSNRLDGAYTPQGIIYTDNSQTFRLDGNNVDIDHETAEEAKNAIQFATLTDLIGRKYSSLRTVITEGKK
jgi:flagellar basal-body rod protein FlgB